MPLIGTGGTVIGARRFLKEKDPNIKVVLGYSDLGKKKGTDKWWIFPKWWRTLPIHRTV